MALELDIGVQAIITTVGGVPSGGTTNSDTPVISGHADPYATVDVYTSATLLGSVTANGHGNWSFQPSEPLFNGIHDLSAVQVTTNGVRSTTNYFAITVEASDTPHEACDGSPSPVVPLHSIGGESGSIPSFPANRFHSKSSRG
jgi:Bacterial Ig-like domain